MKQAFLSILFLMSSALYAETTPSLLFVVNHPGSLPYLYFDKASQSYQGVVPAILQGLIEKQDINIDYISNNRQRSEDQLYQGSGDLTMLSSAWLKSPDKLISTEPIHQHRSFLFSTRPFPEGFSLASSIRSFTLCTRSGYAYPVLSKYFDSERLVRVDSSNHLSMLRMLFKGRCDLVVLNEFSALNLINSSFFEGEELFRSVQPVSVVPLQLVLRAQLIKERELINHHILTLKRSGKLGEIIRQYTQYKKQ